jgi:hypothetical protein
LHSEVNKLISVFCFRAFGVFRGKITYSYLSQLKPSQ